ncbi:MAG: NAD(+) synthase, partial [[Clostridium] fimetarium]|nr:NAD(+) synthase [[Clostridium] fimetarium]
FGDCARRLAPEPVAIVPAVPPAPRAEEHGWSLLREVAPHPFVPASDSEIDSRSAEIVDIQATGLAQRLKATRCRTLVVGISGGLDSTLALLVAARAFDRLGLDRSGIVGVTMPGFGTTGRTRSNALVLMEALGVTSREIPIAKAVEQHFADISHDPERRDVTYENSQARERTQILMDLANELGGMVLGTGDLSELALGWATYNGDHMSMYGVNSSIPKTLASHLVRWFAGHADTEEMRRALLDIVDTPISPELLPADTSGDIAQKTEDLVGPYELHDFFLYYMLRYGFSPKRIFLLASVAFPERPAKEIVHWLRTFCRRFFNQQFKRSCLPDGPKVGSVCLSPRGDWRMPSDASSALWLAECDDIAASIADN